MVSPSGHENYILTGVVNPLAPGLVDCSTSACFSVKRTLRIRRPCTQPSVLETSCFSLRFTALSFAVYCDVAFVCRFAGLPHSRIKLFLSSAYISVHLRFQFVFIADIHDTEGITIRDMKTIRSNPVAEALASAEPL